MSTSQLILAPGNSINTAFEKTSLLDRFLNWCELQEQERLLWVGTSLGLQGCVITPITLFAVIFSGIHTWMIAFTAASIMLTLVVNLAALPLRYAIPAFAVSLFINISLIVTAIISGMEIARYF